MSRRRRTSLITVVAALGIAAPAASAAAAVTYHVSPTGAGNCASASEPCTLTKAVEEAAQPKNHGVNVTVLASSGSYAPLNVESGEESSLDLLGEGQGKTIIEGSSTSRAATLSVSFPVELDQLTLADGTTEEDGGDLYVPAGEGSVFLYLVTVSGGSAACGGGVYSAGGLVSADYSTIAGNRLPSKLVGSCGDGGGIYAGNGLELAHSTVSGNLNEGGGQAAGVAVEGGPATVRDSTIADNSCSESSPCLGGALNLGAGLNAVIYGSTIAGNSDTDEQLEIAAGASLSIGGSILVGGSDCGGTAPTDLGYNLADDSTCGLGSGSMSNVSDSAIALQPLANNGGATETMRIPSSSLAHDAIPEAVELGSEGMRFCSDEDQRGIPRLQGTAASCDTGAYQLAPPVLRLISPSSAEEKLVVTLEGSNLSLVTSVTFGAAMTPGTVLSATATSMTIAVPAGLAPGAEPITVNAPDGSAQIAFIAATLPFIPTTSLPNAEVGIAYSTPVGIEGGVSPYAWSLPAGPLPAGLTLGGSTGVIRGTPTTAGVASFRVRATDVNGFFHGRLFSIDVVPALALASSGSLPSATAGQPYSKALSTSPGTGEAPFTWALDSGSLPRGLTLSRAGVIGGTPAAAGTASSFSVKVTDALGAAAQTTLSLGVAREGRPVIGALSQSAPRWREGGRLPQTSARRPSKAPPLGTTFTFTLNERARVTLAFTQSRVGRVTRGRCVLGGPGTGRGKICRRPVTLGALSFSGRFAKNSVLFQGRLAGAHKLAPGSYTLVVTATSSSGQRSLPRSLGFTIVR